MYFGSGIPLCGQIDGLIFKTTIINPVEVEPDYRQTLTISIPTATVVDTKSPSLGDPPIE